jgi:polysaccharide biosynthesis protein PslG
MRFRALVLFLLLPGALLAQIPEPVLPAGVGVNIHFITGHESDLDAIAAAGFKFIRMDFFWDMTEPKRDAYAWTAYEELLANLEKRGLRALFILDYSNPLYEEAIVSPHPITGEPVKGLASPRQPASVAAFARWAAAAARHFRGRGIVWEIWNEPNGHFWRPKPDAGKYAALALAAGKAVREAVAEATLVGPATAGFDWPFLEPFLTSGALEYLDAVSVHPYRLAPPETAVAEYRRLRDMIERDAPLARKNKIAILSGEWGYSSDGKDVTPERQAAYLVRQQLVNLLCGVPLSIWYDWKNDGPDPKEREQNFGTVGVDMVPKPAYAAVRTLSNELTGFHVAARRDAGREEDFVLVLTDAAGQTKLAAWTMGEPRSIALELEPGPDAVVALTGMSGRKSEASVWSGRLTLPLGPEPQYVALGRAALKKR